MNLEEARVKFLAELEDMELAMKEKLPNLGQQLDLINETLRACPELGHMLNEEEISKIVQGTISESNRQLFGVVSPSGAKKGLKLAKFSAEDMSKVSI